MPESDQPDIECCGLCENECDCVSVEQCAIDLADSEADAETDRAGAFREAAQIVADCAAQGLGLEAARLAILREALS